MMSYAMWWRRGLACRGNDEKNKARRDTFEKTEPIGTDGCMNIRNGGDQTNIHLRSISRQLTMVETLKGMQKLDGKSISR